MVETSAFVGRTPWNGGVKVEDGFIAPSEFMKQAGLDWKVKKEKTYLSDGSVIPDSYAIRRDSDKKVLGVVGKNYVPLQNTSAFDWFTPFIDSRQASFETAGALKEGKVIWVLANANIHGEVVKNDEVKSYILLSHSHDGSLSIRSGFTNIRVVCQNTLAKALNSSTSKLLKIKHTQSAKLALEKVQEIIDVANLDFKADLEQYRYLASKGVSRKQLDQYVTLLLGKEKDEEETKVRKSIVSSIETYFENGRGNELGKGTGWNMYNAVTEYLSYSRGRNESNRLHSLWFGNGVDVNRKALDLATEILSGKI
jgi:phage/plasmid-like protein (TIGR03299 family)